MGDILGGLADGSGGLGEVLGGLAGAGDPGGEAATGGLGALLTSLVPVFGTVLAEGGNVSGADVRQAIGDDELSRLAAELGVSADELADTVAQVLPAVVERLSQEGRLADER
jgi:uncharacterized protein YidB (DUF937 family)